MKRRPNKSGAVDAAARSAPWLAALLLAACALPPPQGEQKPPEIAIPADFPAAGAAGSASLAADLPWSDFVADPGLRELVSLALVNNRDLRAALAAIEQARAQASAREADEWPTLNAGASLSRAPNTLPIGPSISSSNLLGLSVTAYEVDLFGRVRSLADAAKAAALASEEARKTVQIGVVAGVLNSALALRADDENLALTRRTIATREQSLALTEVKRKAGAASDNDLAAARSLLESARAGLAQAQRARALDANALALLLGAPVPDGFAADSARRGDAAAGPDQPAPSAPLFAAIAAGLPSAVLLRRPDVVQAEKGLVAADANIAAARAAFWPKLTLTTSLGTASGELSRLLTGGKLAWSLGAQGLMPIFDAGRNRANLAASEAARRIAIAQYEKAIQSAFREVADALAASASWADQEVAQRAQVEAEAERVRLSALRYEHGAANLLETLDAQRSLFAAQQALVQLRGARAQAQVTLYKALGGGWRPAAAAG